MIKDEIKKCKLTEAEERIYSNIMDFPTLGMYLANCHKPEETVKLLKAELNGRNRFSFVMRIYGRYRRLLPSRDLTELQAWRPEHGKSGKQN